MRSVHNYKPAFYSWFGGLNFALIRPSRLGVRCLLRIDEDWNSTNSARLQLTSHCFRISSVPGSAETTTQQQQNPVQSRSQRLNQNSLLSAYVHRVRHPNCTAQSASWLGTMKLLWKSRGVFLNFSAGISLDFLREFFTLTSWPHPPPPPPPLGW